MKLLTMGVLAVVAVWVVGFPTRMSTQISPLVKDEPRKYCGSGLTSILTFVCNGQFNTVETVPAPHVMKLEFSQPRHEALSLIPHGSRRRRGVYDECCRKSCSIAQIKLYCAES